MRKARLSRTPLRLAALAGVLLAAPQLMAEEGYEFPHQTHLEEGLECSGCHDLAAKPVPTLKTDGCTDCHDDGAPSPLAPGAVRLLGQGVSYPHATHADAFDCKDCHASTLEGDHAAGTPVVGPERCLSCHSDNGAGPGEGDCATCHGKDRSKEEPAGHLEPSWRHIHGKKAEDPASKGHGKACATCHGGGGDGDFCMSCHQRKRAMSHAAHLQERDAECSGCHPGVAKTAQPTVDSGYCADCHEGTVQVKTIVAPGRALSANFDHRRHVSVPIECKTCHAATLADAQPAGQPLVAADTCFDCHERMEAEAPERNCGRCHGAQRRRQMAPADHMPGWLFSHGHEAEAREMGASHGQQCAQCHQASACKSCHATMRPRSHTGMWRLRAHGLVASWDRSTCTTCHETGSCIGCHRRTPPLNHAGAWRVTHGLAAGERDNPRCMVCHSPNWCTTCHLSGVTP